MLKILSVKEEEDQLDKISLKLNHNLFYKYNYISGLGEDI